MSEIENPYAKGVKPCPFCHGVATAEHHGHENTWSVGCDNDDCMGFRGLGWLYPTREEAIQNWNNRPIEEYLKMLIKSLVRIISSNIDIILANMSYRLDLQEVSNILYDCQTYLRTEIIREKERKNGEENPL